MPDCKLSETAEQRERERGGFRVYRSLKGGELRINLLQAGVADQRRRNQTEGRVDSQR